MNNNYKELIYKGISTGRNIKAEAMAQAVIVNDSNWDIVDIGEGRFDAIAIKDGCDNSTYGDIHHIRRLMLNYKTHTDPKKWTFHGLRLLKKTLRQNETLKDFFRYCQQ
jgi:hypothetical protein